MEEDDRVMCANCGAYEVEKEGQHCSKRCDQEYWADMDRDEQ